MIQQKQQRDEDWKAKKTAEREELGQLSDDAVMRVTSEPDAYLHYLDTQAINPRYSASNVMLAMAQNPEITISTAWRCGTGWGAASTVTRTA